MRLSQIGNAAGEAAHDAGATRLREPAAPVPAAPVPAAPLPASPVPADGSAVARTLAVRAVVARPVGPPVPADDSLLDAIRRGLVPVDPVARLLAGWTAPPVRPVKVPPGVPATRQPEPA